MSPGTTADEVRRLRLLGVLYVAIVAGLVWLSIAIYSKTFTDDVDVHLDAREAGLQLNVGGDVRMNGSIVGRVARVEPADGGAVIDLQIDREAAAQIPTDVTARILPTTLFGQKFVELRSSTRVVGDAHLAAGSRIQQDTGPEATEISDLLDRLDPLLTAVPPQRLATTLSALSTGLSGRGERLGDLIDDSGAYLAELNASLPDLTRDLGLLASVSQQYADAAPDLLDTAGNASITSRTLRAEAATLDAFLDELGGAATSGDRLLRSAGDDLVDAVRLGRPTLELVASYSPEIVCVLEGFLAANDRAASSIKGGILQGNISFTSQLPGYGEDDQFELTLGGTGPACRGLPDPPVPFPDYTLGQGYDRPPPNSLLPILLGPGVGP